MQGLFLRLLSLAPILKKLALVYRIMTVVQI